MDDLEKRISILEVKVKKMENDIHEIKESLLIIKHNVDVLMGQNSSIHTLVKWVIVPLIIILGALVGVKISLPVA